MANNPNPNERTTPQTGKPQQGQPGQKQGNPGQQEQQKPKDGQGKSDGQKHSPQRS